MENIEARTWRAFTAGETYGSTLSLEFLRQFSMLSRGNTVYRQATFQTLMFIVLNADGPPSMESNLGALKGGSVLRGFSKDYSKPVPEVKKER